MFLLGIKIKLFREHRGEVSICNQGCRKMLLNLLKSVELRIMSFHSDLTAKESKTHATQLAKGKCEAQVHGPCVPL